MRLDALAFIGALALGGALTAQEPARAPKSIARIVGVYDDDTGRPIDSAEVRDLVSGSFALTTITGTVVLSFVDTGGSLVRIRKIGYEPLTLYVGNAPSDSTPMTLTLQPVAQFLPRVTTLAKRVDYRTAFLKAFEERREHNLGHFIPEAVFRQEEARTLGDVLRSHIPGLRVIDDRLNVARVLSCIDIYVDGALLSGNQLKPVVHGNGRIIYRRGPGDDLNQFPVTTIAGAEFHRVATVPIEYSRQNGSCGVLLLWTRER